MIGEFPPRCEPCRSVKKRWKNDKENHIRIQCGLGDCWNKAEEQSTKHEDNGIRSLEFFCQRSKGHNEEQQQQEDYLECMNAAALHGSSVAKGKENYSVAECRSCLRGVRLLFLSLRPAAEQRPEARARVRLSTRLQLRRAEPRPPSTTESLLKALIR